jgi:hypothetical protein
VKNESSYPQITQTRKKWFRENRRQKAESRRQKAEGRRQKAEGSKAMPLRCAVNLQLTEPVTSISLGSLTVIEVIDLQN